VLLGDVVLLVFDLGIVDGMLKGKIRVLGLSFSKNVSFFLTGWGKIELSNVVKSNASKCGSEFNVIQTNPM